MTASVLLAAMASVPLAAEDSFNHQPFYLMGGLSRLGQSEARDLTTDKGIHGGFGYVSGDVGLVGSAGIDLDWRHALGGSNRIDSVSSCYTERAYGILGDAYLGYGVGSVYNRVERHSPLANSVDKGWRIAAKAIIGYTFGAGVILEGAWFYSGHMGGLDTGGFTVSAGIWF